MCIRKISWSSHVCRPVGRSKSSHLLLLCTLVYGYHWLSYKHKNQLQPMAGYRETRNSLPDSIQSRREKITWNGRYLWQFKYVNAILIVLCMSNSLIRAYITGIHDKRIITSCTTWHLLQTIRVFRLLPSILSTNNFAIKYSADYL